MREQKLVEWKCWAVPETPNVHCGHMNIKVDRRTARDLNRFTTLLCCDKCGRPKAASDHRLAKINKETTEMIVKLQRSFDGLTVLIYDEAKDIHMTLPYDDKFATYFDNDSSKVFVHAQIVRDKLMILGRALWQEW